MASQHTACKHGQQAEVWDLASQVWPGFHKIHVSIGALFLSVCCMRLWKARFTQQHHFG